MTESEAIKILQRDLEIQVKNKALTDGIEAVKFAIQALEKQIPKKPKERDRIGCNTPVCPVCKMDLYSYEPYCDNCGQKLDWSDGE